MGFNDSIDWSSLREKSDNVLQGMASSAATNRTTTGQVNVSSLTNNRDDDNKSIYAPPVIQYAPPVGPNLKPLVNKQKQIERRNKVLIDEAMADFDALSASTTAIGMQSANNAGTTYANRLMQSGINPVASGVVAAQAKLPVFDKTNQIAVQKEQFKAETQGRTDALTASIAQALGQLRQSYSATLADYNKSYTGYQLDLNKFNADQALRGATAAEQTQMERDRLALERERLNASIAASGTGPLKKNPAVIDAPLGGNFNPGYIGGFGTLQPATLNGSPMGNGRTAYVGYPASWT